MRVSLAPTHVRHRHAADMARRTAQPWLAPEGPRVVLGRQTGPDRLVPAVRPGWNTLFGPRGACLAAPDGPLFVCDTGHHRLLIWTQRPMADHADADHLIGQPDSESEGRNGHGPIGAATFNVPTGIATDRGMLAVADPWNHRVMIWLNLPDTTNQPADVVLGQADFSGGLPNRGADSPRADTLNWCYGVAIVAGRLIVADTGNRRVLVWDGIPAQNGAPADLVLGQRDFVTRDENAGHGGAAVGMRWPHGIAAVGDMLLVSDAGDNRVMAWSDWPRANGTPCDFVLGQADLRSLDHNRGEYYPSADAMSMPYGLTRQGDRLVVADTANSRLLGFDSDMLGMGAHATWLAGQTDFSQKGDNRWSLPVRDSLCWPYNVSACGQTLVVADSGNNRVLLWDVAP